MNKEEFTKLIVSELSKLTNEDIQVNTPGVIFNNKIFVDISVIHKDFEIIYKGKYKERDSHNKRTKGDDKNGKR